MLTDRLGIVEPEIEIRDLEEAGWTLISNLASRFSLARADHNLRYLEILTVYFW